MDLFEPEPVYAVFSLDGTPLPVRLYDVEIMERPGAAALLGGNAPARLRRWWTPTNHNDDPERFGCFALLDGKITEVVVKKVGYWRAGSGPRPEGTIWRKDRSKPAP